MIDRDDAAADLQTLFDALEYDVTDVTVAIAPKFNDLLPYEVVAWSGRLNGRTVGSRSKFVDEDTAIVLLKRTAALGLIVNEMPERDYIILGRSCYQLDRKDFASAVMKLMGPWAIIKRFLKITLSFSWRKKHV